MSTKSSTNGVRFIRRDNVTVAEFVAPEISELRNVGDLLSEFKDQIAEHKPENLIIDFAGVHFIGSAGINMLLVVLKRVRTYGGRLCLCNMKGAAYQTLRVTQLTRIFEIVDDRPAALAAVDG